MSVLGAIEVQMLMDLARWKQGIDDSGRMLDTGLAKMKSAIGGVMGGLMAGLSAAAFASWIKGAIDAGDATKEFSQKTGVAAKDVAGLQLAFRQGGVDGDALTTAIGKMSKQMAEGNKAFQSLGVNTRNADGSMRSVMEVLYDTADAFSEIEDGPAKSAKALELWGKAGLAMIPTMNEGSKGLREMAAMAEKLGLVIDQNTADAADKFNDTLDLLNQGSQGMARQVAAQLLPTLNGLAGALLKNKTEGDGMKKMADAITVALKSLFTVGAVGVEIFSSLGKVLGGAAAAVIAFIKGEYSEAWNITKATAEGVGDSISGTAQVISDAWSGAGAKSVEQLAAMDKASRKLNEATKEQEAAAKKAAEEQAKLTKAGQDYVDGINAQYGAMQQQISLGRELTDGEKELIKLEEKLASGKMILTDAERLAVEMKLREIDATKEQRKQAEEYLKLVAAVAQHASKWNDEQAKSTETLRAGNVALIEENEKLRIGAQAWEARQRAVLLSQAADLEWQAANQGGNFQLEEQARLLRERAQLMGDGTALKEAKAVADEWRKTADTIQNGIAGALQSAFEKGGNFFRNLVDIIEAWAKNYVLKLVIQPVATGATNFLMGAAGQGQPAGTGSWVGSASMASRLYGAGNWLYGGAAAAGNYGAVYSGAAYGTGFGTQQSAMLAAQESGMVSQAGSASASSWGSAAGWAAAIIAGVYKANKDYNEGFGPGQARDVQRDYGIGGREADLANFMSKIGFSDKMASLLSGATAVAALLGRAAPQVTGTGIQGTLSAGDFSGTGYADIIERVGTVGRFFGRKDKNYTTAIALDNSIERFMSGAAKGILDQAKKYGEALNLPVGQLQDVATDIKVAMGDDAAANKKAIVEALGGYGDALVAGWKDALAPMANEGESTVDTLLRVASNLRGVNSVFETLGLHLVQTSVSGAQAAGELVQLTGGLDAFMAKTQAYLANYFTQSEQLGLGAKGVLETLQQAGIDFGGASSRGDLRSLMEQLDPNTADGRGQMAALLNVSADFAKLTAYLQESGLTLGALAALAPKSGTLLGADDPRRTTPDDATRSTALLATANDSLSNIATSSAGAVTELQALVATTVAANKALNDRIAELSARLEELQRPAYLADLN